MHKDSLNTKSKLIIGASGFLGTHLLKMLLAGSDQVYVALRPQDRITAVAAEKQISFAALDDISDDIDTVYLLAAHIPYEAPDEYTKKLIESNVELPLLVVKHFPKAKIIYASSVSIYGTQNGGVVIDEQGPFGHPFAYGLSKLAGEMVVRTHPKFAILRLSSLFGPNMCAPTFIRSIIHSALRDKKITLFGDGARLQNYLFVEDACKMLMVAANVKENFIGNAVGNRSISNKDIAEKIAKIIGNIQIIFKDDDTSLSSQYSNQLLLQMAKDFTYTPLEKSLRETIDAFRKES